MPSALPGDMAKNDALHREKEKTMSDIAVKPVSVAAAESLDGTNTTCLPRPIRWLSRAVSKSRYNLKGEEQESPGRHGDSELDQLANLLGLSTAVAAGYAPVTTTLEKILKVDWASTPLGPLRKWPRDVLQELRMVLLTPVAQAIFVGEGLYVICNAAYDEMNKERSLQGRKLLEAEPENKELNKSIVDHVNTTGLPYLAKNFDMSLWRGGVLEETFWSFYTVGFLPPTKAYRMTVVEETQLRLRQRRDVNLQNLTEACAKLKDTSALWKTVIQVMEKNDKDFPLGFLYTRQQTTNSTLTASVDDQAYCLRGVMGHVTHTSDVPPTINLATGQEDFIAGLGKVRASRTCETLRTSDGTLPESLVDISQGRGFGDRCHQAIAMPIAGSKPDEFFGFLVLGLNTRRPYDAEFKQFIRHLVRILAEIAVAVVARESESLSAKRAALLNAAEKTKLAEENQEITIRNRRLWDFFQLIDVGTFECDLECNVLQANDAYWHLTGRRTGIEAQDKRVWWQCLHPDDLSESKDRWQKVLLGVAQKGAIRVLKPRTGVNANGPHSDVQWLLIMSMPLFDSEGKVTAVSGCVVDIQAQKVSEMHALEKAEALDRARTLEHRLSTFMEKAPMAIHMFTPDQKLIYCNDQWFELYGRERAPFAEVDWADSIVAEDLQALRDSWKGEIADKATKVSQFRVKRRQGAATYEKWVEGTLFPEFNDDGTPKVMMAVTRDISHQKWQERAQRQRLNEATEAIESKRQQASLIDMTAHEIRNPLGVVLHSAEAVMDSLSEIKSHCGQFGDRISKEDREHLQEILDNSHDALATIVSSTSSQLSMINNLSILSKLSNHALTITPSLEQASTLVDNVLETFRRNAKEEGVELRVFEEKSIYQLDVDWLLVDSERVAQIIHNIVANAVESAKQGEERQEVELRVGASLTAPSQADLTVNFFPARNRGLSTDNLDANWVPGQSVYLHFVIRDTGYGLTKKDMSMLLERLSQETPQLSASGTSRLGLYIAKELTEMQGGRIGIASNEGSGATLAFYVKTRLAMPPTRMARIRSTPTDDGGQTSYSILMVEDNIVNQTVLSKQLKRLGHQVHLASNGTEALEVLRRSSQCTTVPRSMSVPTLSVTHPAGPHASENHFGISVILMDVEMPIMDGIECTRKIREMEEEGELEGRIPIIAVTANKGTDHAGTGHEGVMDDAIVKPFKVVDLMKKIERVVGY